MTEKIRPASTLAKAIVAILVGGLACSAAPMQDRPDKDTPDKQSPGARPVAAISSGDPTTANHADPPNATGVNAASTVQAAESGAKGPAGGVPAGGSTPPSAPGKPAEKPPPADRGVPDDYQIGAGDVLHIGVFHEPDATVQSVVVRTDGKISMPLIKEVAVMGLTPSQLEKQITEELSKFLPAPDVTVIVTAINSKKIYVIGAVRREGPLQFTYPMNVLQALTEAGGLSDFAKHKKIYVLRAKNGREVKLPFDYDAVLKGEHMDLNVPLLAGDTIVVPGGP